MGVERDLGESGHERKCTIIIVFEISNKPLNLSTMHNDCDIGVGQATVKLKWRLPVC